MSAAVQFEHLLAELEADKQLNEKLRDQGKELDRSYRAIATILNRAHSTPADGGEKSSRDLDFELLTGIVISSPIDSGYDFVL